MNKLSVVGIEPKWLGKTNLVLTIRPSHNCFFICFLFNLASVGRISPAHDRAVCLNCWLYPETYNAHSPATGLGIGLLDELK